MINILSRQNGITDQEIELMREKVRIFLDRAPLEESTLILDGPGLGCSRAFLVFPLLGIDRLRKLKAIHSFSASAYSLFWYQANCEGQLTFDKNKLENWNKENQLRHGIRTPVISLLQILGRKASGKKFVFSGDRLEDAMTFTVSDSFRLKKVKELQKNINLWTYCKDESRFVNIKVNGELNEITLGQVMRALTAIPKIYEPFKFAGKKYTDAIMAPGVRDLFRKLRQESKNCLFVHMGIDGERDGTLFLKAHSNGTGVQRVLIDFLYFTAGLRNRDFDSSLKKLLSDIEPV